VVIAKSTDTEGLYFIPRGNYSDDVPELLDGEGMPALLNHLKQRFSVVMIDTPPLSAGIDAVMIGAHADAVLAVLRKGRTDLDLARAKIDSFSRMLGIPIVGAILNDVDREGPYRYYTYSYDVHYDEAT
jgi:tyrosine-protein kinase Etk/Wzc